MIHPTDSGTGPFELRQHSGHSALIARNAAWWGTGLRLGPAIDSVDLSYVSSSEVRARMLRRGAVDVAEDLDRSAARALRRDPLVDVESAGGTTRGVSRSVRGISGELPSLQAAWLTTIGG
jgi:ABC-type transport system substrate-binding protein